VFAEYETKHLHNIFADDFFCFKCKNGLTSISPQCFYIIINFTDCVVLQIFLYVMFYFIHPLGESWLDERLSSTHQALIKPLRVYRLQWHSASSIYQTFVKHTSSTYQAGLMSTWWFGSGFGNGNWLDRYGREWEHKKPFPVISSIDLLTESAFTFWLVHHCRISSG